MARATRTERRRVQGTSLALKLAAAITLMVVVFMVLFAVFLRGFITSAMKDEVKASAIEAARAGAQVELSNGTAGARTAC